MKNPDRTTVSRLQKLPNVGPATEQDFKVLGILHPRDLIGKDAFVLHEKLCKLTGIVHDPCMIDVFMAAIDFMEGGDALPWWNFTQKRKDMLRNI